MVKYGSGIGKPPKATPPLKLIKVSAVGLSGIPMNLLNLLPVDGMVLSNIGIDCFLIYIHINIYNIFCIFNSLNLV